VRSTAATVRSVIAQRCIRGPYSATFIAQWSSGRVRSERL
jgi:hypothetical protein